MLFLSEDGALVLIEVKNERTSREIIGQALEYTARFQGATLEEVADGAGITLDNLDEGFRQRFSRSPVLSSMRHIVFVAPEFDVTCHVTVPYLRHLATDGTVEFHLMRAISNLDGFDVRREDEPVATSRMPVGSCGVSRRGTVYVVLKAGTPPVLWRVGTLHDNEIIARGKPRLRFDDRLLHPFQELPPQLDLTESGSAWTKQAEPQKTAIVLGMLRDRATGDTHHLVRFRSGQFQAVKSKLASELHHYWTRDSTNEFDWRTLRGLTTTGADGALK